MRRPCDVFFFLFCFSLLFFLPPLVALQIWTKRKRNGYLVKLNWNCSRISRQMFKNWILFSLQRLHLSPSYDVRGYWFFFFFFANPHQCNACGNHMLHTFDTSNLVNKLNSSLSNIIICIYQPNFIIAIERISWRICCKYANIDLTSSHF